MYDKDTRTLLFFGVCVPLRTYLAVREPQKPLLRTAAAVIAYRWLSGKEDATHGRFGGVAWWAEERLHHGLLWLLYSLTGDARALKADVVLGLLNWWAHSINFRPA